jgi:hypothetical protein
MNKTKNILIAAVLFISLGAYADDSITNAEVASTNLTVDSTKYDIALGGSGYVTSRGKDSSQGINASFSLDPFKAVRPLWFGISQSAAFRPFTGETDADADWVINLYNQTYFINPGWSAGIAYGSGKPILKTGPEVQLQYYVSDTAFFYADANYNLQNHQQSNWTWGIGIGIEL